ncbi:hypothetical protein [Nostoc sp. FACHB-110]|uniref:hypothetical protein n=1 Tax=Nostoc sp. FACHB-110 TaxID=2692834 RepID=UPI00168601E1|nr:hypothetical protein [Nostoc sp. FACHB-110]MBD2440201.1 hypothetical protein [Nostoc sp. FACHB-110]
MMNNFSLSKTFATFAMPDNPLPTTINLSPVSLPDTSSPWYAAPIIVMPSTSQYKF